MYCTRRPLVWQKIPLKNCVKRVIPLLMSNKLYDPPDPAL